MCFKENLHIKFCCTKPTNRLCKNLFLFPTAHFLIQFLPTHLQHICKPHKTHPQTKACKRANFTSTHPKFKLSAFFNICCRFIVYFYIFVLKVIATDKLHIDKIKRHFKDKPVFETQDIITFYEQIEKSIKSTTVNWRVYSLVQIGILQRIGRGKFTLGKGKTYIPEISSVIKAIFKKLKTEFPYINLCVWNTSVLNEFMLHQPNQFYYLIEADKETTHSVFYFLREFKKSVFIDPTNDIFEKYILNEKEVFIVKTLISEAPTQNINGVETATIEKMLVDIFCDDVIFSAQQGAEMRTIFQEAFNKYTINQSKMVRYADRRRKKEDFSQFVKTITNLWQH